MLVQVTDIVYEDGSLLVQLTLIILLYTGISYIFKYFNEWIHLHPAVSILAVSLRRHLQHP